MRVPQFIVAFALTVVLAIQSWTLAEIVGLKVSVASLQVKVDLLQKQTASHHEKTDSPIALRN